MLDQKETHREVKNPQITLRYLADYMAATERSRRTIVRGCKYQAIARVIQHDEAKVAVSRSLWDADVALTFLQVESQRLRDRLADTEFDRELFDHNADYIDRFIEIQKSLELPKAEFSEPGPRLSTTIHGLKVSIELHLRLRRATRTNKFKVGVASLRYAKGKALPHEVANYQSAFLFGYLQANEKSDDVDPDQKLCLTIDAYSGTVFHAPSDAITRFRNMEAACATIAERWTNIAPPAAAVLK